MAQRARGAAAGPRPADRVGSRPGLDLTSLRARLRTVIEPIVTAADLDLEDLTVTRAGRRHVVRVTVDGDAGVGHDGLSAISRDVSAGLDSAEQAGGELPGGSYTLEVSSPGIDRPLTQARHWRRNVGRLVKVRAGERDLTARVVAVDGVDVRLDADGRTQAVPFDQLGPGRVQVEFGAVAQDGREEQEDGP